LTNGASCRHEAWPAAPRGKNPGLTRSDRKEAAMTGSRTTLWQRLGMATAAAIAVALLGALTIAVVLAPLAAAEGAPSVTRAAATGTIIVVKRAGTQDSLWSVSPAGAGATKLIDLPFRPGRMVGSPDHGKIAILPSPGRARIYVYDVAGAKLTALSFAPRGVRRIDGLTWLSSARILVSATKSSRVTKYPLTDRLYTITTTGGKPVAFRGLRGTEPSAAPGAARLLYVRLRDGGTAADPRSRMVVEDLMSLRLAPGSKPHVVKHARYTDSLDIRRFRDPDVSPDGKYVVSSTTGSDVSVTYAVRRVASGRLVRAKNTTLGPRDRTAWSHGSSKVAFWGMPPSGNMQSAALYVYDVASTKIRSDGPFTKVAVTGLAWAPDDSLLAYALRPRSGGVDKGHLWTIEPGMSATPTDLGEGSLPVWVP
jgi:hypothetical protein